MQRFATASLASGIALGATARQHARRPSGWRVPRRLHQTAFASSLVFLGAAAWSLRRTSRSAATAHAVALVVLSTLPFTSGGHPNHIRVAVAASMLHGIGIVVSRPHRC